MLRAEFAEWMADDVGYARSTRTTRLQNVDQAERFVQKNFGRRLARCQHEHVRAFLATLENPKTRNSYRDSLRVYFRFLKERQYRTTDPMAEIRRLPEPRYLPRPLSMEEAWRLRAGATALSLRHRLIVDLALHAGGRRSEIAALRWSDVDLKAKRLRIFGKGRKEAVIPLHDVLVSELYLWRITVPSNDYIFPSNRPGRRHLHPAYIWQIVKEAGRMAGLDVAPHQLRHSFATALFEAGADIRTVQELLRHSSLASTEIYTKVSIGRLEQDMARLDFGG